MALRLMLVAIQSNAQTLLHDSCSIAWATQAQPCGSCGGATSQMACASLLARVHLALKTTRIVRVNGGGMKHVFAGTFALYATHTWGPR